jgi:hypothetical protein
MSKAMKALVCLAAVCVIGWCAADIAIKVEQVRQMRLLVRAADAAGEAIGSPDLSGIVNSLASIAQEVCSLSPGTKYEVCAGVARTAHLDPEIR